MTHFLSLSPRSFICASLLGVASLTTVVPALAQDGGVDLGEDDDTAVELDDSDGGDAVEQSADASAQDDTVDASEAPDDEPEERKPDGSIQLLMGARYRLNVVPKALINFFPIEGGRTVVSNQFGGEIGGYFGKKGDGFLVMFSGSYAAYPMDAVPFREKNGDGSWEIVESRLKAGQLAIDTMWDHKIIDKLSFTVGASFGVALVSGKLYRDEAYADSSPNADFPAEKDWPGLSRCEAPNDPSSLCPQGNYGVSDRWDAYPLLNFQLGMRYQPIDEVVTRFEMGLGSTGIWFGLGVDYSLFL